MVPAYRSATSRASAAISGVRTGSGETTRSRAARRPRVLADRGPLQQVAADKLTGEPDPDPAAGHRARREPFGHQVVEGPVQMGQRHIDQDPGHRQLRRRSLRGR